MTKYARSSPPDSIASSLHGDREPRALELEQPREHRGGGQVERARELLGGDGLLDRDRLEQPPRLAREIAQRGDVGSRDRAPVERAELSDRGEELGENVLGSGAQDRGVAQER